MLWRMVVTGRWALAILVVELLVWTGDGVDPVECLLGQQKRNVSMKIINRPNRSNSLMTVIRHPQSTKEL